MITRELINRYEGVAGPIAFTLARVAPEMEGPLVRLMLEVIEGVRPPLTDRDLGISSPPNAES